MGAQQQGYMYALERPVDSLSAIVSRLQQEGWLPPGQSWWFGWCALEIRLPGLLTNGAELPTTWEIIHIFSPWLELRWFRRAQRHQALLLTEKEAAFATADWKAVGVYYVESTRRFLVGEQWQIGDQTVRGSLQFPRRLEYNLPGEAEINGAKGHSLMADVLEYYDDEHRLVTVRYASIRAQGQAPDRVADMPKEVRHG